LPPSGFEAFRISERAHARTLLDAIGSGTTSPVASLAAIRAEALDAGTVLIEYFLGERRGWLWLVSRDAFESFALPGRSTIEPLVHRYYEALTARNAKIPGEAPEGRAQRLREAETSEQKSAAELSRMLLSPVRARLAGRRVLIVDDGPLRLAPFAALGVENEVVLVPSASYLVQARRAAGKAASSQKILILADPVFDTAGGAFPRLPQTRREAETIAALSPAGQVEKRLDYDASLASLRRASTAGFGTIHIATHAVVDSRHPELSGIILSQVDRNGKPQPGVLRLREIYNLHLNTGLVTLSACETAVGKDVSGEGMIGLSHAFLCAGAQRVVASLWKVEDAATAKLMESFYRGLYARKLSPPAALRAAQNELRADARWRSPYYWAGFVIEGDWR
jgi:CHAT domain-containing protein